METTNKHFWKRDAIFYCLRHTDTHPSAETVHQMLQEEYPDISLATVYRNLALFKRQGLIQSLGTVGGVERFDANTAPHVHFICENCDAVSDLHEIHFPQSLAEDVSNCYGNEMHGCQLTINGLCSDCLKNL